MKINSRVRFFLSFVCIGMWLIGGSSTALGDSAATLGERVNNSAAARQTGADANKPVERYVTIDFEDVDINLFIKYISELTGKNFIVDKAVRGNITIISPTKISI